MARQTADVKALRARIRELEEEIAAQKRFMAELETRFQGTKAGDPAR